MRSYHPALVILVSVVLLVGCGGGDLQSGATQTPAGAPQSQIASTSPAAGWCEAALPPGPVAFTGAILTYEPAKDVPRSSEFYRTIVRLTIVQVEVRGAGREYKFKYVPGEVAEVVLLTDRWPVAEPGDCVLVVGDVGLWACGATCDAAGFVASRFEVVTGE